MKQFLKTFALATFGGMVLFCMYKLDLLNLHLVKLENVWNWFLGMIFCQIVCQILMILRFQSIVNSVGISMSLKDNIAATSLSQAVGQMLPGSLAVSEGMRIAIMLKNVKDLGKSKSLVAISSLFDRVIGFFTILTLGFFGCLLLIFKQFSDKGASNLGLNVNIGLLLLTVFSLVGMLGGILLVFFSQSQWLRRVLLFLPKKIEILAVSALDSVYSCTKSAKQILVPFVYSVITLLFAVLSLYASGKSVLLDFDFWQLLTLFPVIALTALLPLGVAGLGGYQLVVASLFQIFGFAAADVSVANLMLSTATIVVTTFMGLFFGLPAFKKLKKLDS